MIQTRTAKNTPSTRLLQGLLQDFPWRFYQRVGISNLVTNVMVGPVDSVPPELNVGEDILNIRRDEYQDFLRLESMARFREYDFAFDKVLEYITSLRLLQPSKTGTHLDAAGGWGEFAAALKELRVRATVYCLDALPHKDKSDGVVRLVGSAAAMPLPDESVDTVSCHHSFEHFRGDEDVGFLKELLRVLRPGGRACIVPFFLCDAYAEIWNSRPAGKYAARAKKIYDPFGTFPGWGRCERFARVYDVEAVQQRLMPMLAGRATVRIVHVAFEGRPAPDMRRNRHQPRLNSHMKALYIERRAPKRGRK